MITTKDRIATEALRVFADRGYDGATIGEIARRAGITEGAIYRHFESKKELFLASIEPVVATLADQMVTAMQKATDPRSVIRAAVSARVRLLSEHLDTFNILFTEAPRHPELAETLWNRVVLPEWERNQPVIDGLVAGGALPNRPGLLTGVLGMTSAIWALLVLSRPGGPIQRTQEALIDEMTEFAMYGVAGRPDGEERNNNA